MRTFFARHTIIRKLSVTFLFLLLFILGQHIQLPLLTEGATSLSDESSQAMALVTGGDATRLHLFSLGLGPWMYASLLVQLFIRKDQARSMSPAKMQLWINGVMLVIALVQALGMLMRLSLFTSSDVFLVWVTVSTLVAGAFVLYWFGQMMTSFGLGGSIVLVAANIILSQAKIGPLLAQFWAQKDYAPLICLFLWMVVIVWTMVILERAEYRVPIQRVAIHNDYAQGSYLPLKLNLVGGMPLMYAYSLLALPQYFLQFLSLWSPKWAGLQQFSSYFDTRTIFGVGFYSLSILLLTFSLAFVTIDPYEKAEQLRASGDYIPGVRPGKATKDAISHLLVLFSWFNGLYLILLSALPLLVSIGHPEWQDLSTFSGTAVLFTGMMLTILEELRVLRLKEQYQSIF